MFGAVLYLLSFLMFLVAGLWWLVSQVWAEAPNGEGILAGFALAFHLIGGTIASVTGEMDG